MTSREPRFHPLIDEVGWAGRPTSTPNPKPLWIIGSRRPDEQQDEMVKLRVEVQLFLALWLEVGAAATGMSPATRKLGA